MDDFASGKIVFLALSPGEIAQNQKPAVTFRKDEKKSNTVHVGLQITAVPDLGERMSQTTPCAFYRIIAIEKAFLTQFDVVSWDKATMLLDTPTEQNIACTTP